MIKHLSFDVWLTLLKSHPDFKKAKAAMLAQKYNPKKLTEFEIAKMMRKIDVQCTRLTEIQGLHFDSLQMIAFLLLEMGYEELAPIDHSTLSSISDEFQDIFLKNPPSLYDENTFRALDILSDIVPTLTIGSNTGFILGETIREVLRKEKVYFFFQDEYFSDEIQVAKPNLQFFGWITTRSRFVTKDILHVGDNPIADGFGPTQVGMQSMIINSNDKTIMDVVDLVKEVYK